jgi:hypothetical protein
MSTSHFHLAASLVHEITPHFAATEDTTMVRRIHSVRQETENALVERQRSTKQIIKGMGC